MVGDTLAVLALPCSKLWLKSQLATGLIRAIKPDLLWKRTMKSRLKYLFLFWNMVGDTLAVLALPCSKLWLKSQLATGLIRAIKPGLLWKRTLKSRLKYLFLFWKMVGDTLAVLALPCSKLWLKSQLATGLIRAIKPGLLWKCTMKSRLKYLLLFCNMVGDTLAVLALRAQNYD